MISIRPLTLDSTPRLIEEDGIGYLSALANERDASNAEYDPSKNEVSIESTAAVYQHNQTDLEFLVAGRRPATGYTVFLPDGTP